MKRLILISGWVAFLVLALLFAGQALAQSGHTGAYLRVWSDDGTMQDYQCQAVDMGETATPEANETPIPTALPPTFTPTLTPVPSVTPQPTATLLPTCAGTVTIDGLNARAAPWGEIVTQYNTGQQIGNITGVWDRSKGVWELWYKGTANGKSVYVYATFVQINPGSQCNIPPQPTTTARTAPTSRLGLHLTVGASQDVVYAALPRLGSLKGTTGTESILIGARQRRPDLLILYRVVSPDCPTGWGSGDSAAVADSLWNQKYTQWQRAGMIGVADYFELVNECGTPASAWETAFWLRILDNARIAGECLALFSDSYGTPEILQFQARAAILNTVLDGECKPGMHHAIAMHSYEGVAGGSWKFGRYQMIMSAMGEKYRQIPILFTEYAYSTGNPPVDCSALWTDWAQAAAIFEDDPQVWGAEYFNVSSVGQWADVSKCLK